MGSHQPLHQAAHSALEDLVSKQENPAKIQMTPGGGVTTIYEGTGCAIFWGAFFPAENKFCGIIFGKITSSHKIGGVILEK